MKINTRRVRIKFIWFTLILTGIAIALMGLINLGYWALPPKFSGTLTEMQIDKNLFVIRYWEGKEFLTKVLNAKTGEELLSGDYDLIYTDDGTLLVDSANLSATVYQLQNDVQKIAEIELPFPVEDKLSQAGISLDGRYLFLQAYESEQEPFNLLVYDLETQKLVDNFAPTILSNTMVGEKSISVRWVPDSQNELEIYLHNQNQESQVALEQVIRLDITQGTTSLVSETEAEFYYDGGSPSSGGRFLDAFASFGKMDGFYWSFMQSINYIFDAPYPVVVGFGPDTGSYVNLSALPEGQYLYATNPLIGKQKLVYFDGESEHEIASWFATRYHYQISFWSLTERHVGIAINNQIGIIDLDSNQMALVAEVETSSVDDYRTHTFTNNLIEMFAL